MIVSFPVMIVSFSVINVSFSFMIVSNPVIVVDFSLLYSVLLADELTSQQVILFANGIVHVDQRLNLGWDLGN